MFQIGVVGSGDVKEIHSKLRNGVEGKPTNEPTESHRTSVGDLQYHMDWEARQEKQQQVFQLTAGLTPPG